MALCSACRAVNVPALTSELQQVPDWWEQAGSRSKPRGMVHLRDARQLPLSAAAGCSLCILIRDAVLQYNSKDFHPLVWNPLEASGHTQQTWNMDRFEQHLIERPIYLRPNYDPLQSAFPGKDVANARHIRGFKAFVPVDLGVIIGQCRLFAPIESPAAVSCDIVGRPALSASDSPEAYALISRWIASCSAQHLSCRETLSGALIDESSPPILPTRVIHVGQPNEGISPRLVETHGTRGFYCALSHCWGNPRKRPLITTQANHASHLALIPWHTLPPLYRDMINATRQIGFEYIWIDSLCIIQDSHEDWLYESKRMGTLYERASLTLAASHSSDASQSCFLPRQYRPSSVELPHISHAGEPAGSVFATLMPAEYTSISPESGPLAFRAWATQEWLLSRRILFYTDECLAWSCKVISQRETGGSFHSTARNTRWKTITEKYSARQLTNSSDRLIALEGLRTEMGKKKATDTYCFGLWKHSMPDQLLWYCVEPAERAKSSLHLPTWSWASTMHGVRFLHIQNAKNACEKLEFDDTGRTLLIQGFLSKANGLKPLQGPLPGNLGSTMPPNLVVGIKDGVILGMALMCVDGETSIGWAVMDEIDIPDLNSLYYFRLMSKKTKATQPSNTKQTYRLDWIIVLQQTRNLSNSYRRVGAGIIEQAGHIDGQMACVCIS